jgi:hypothetical protein
MDPNRILGDNTNYAVELDKYLKLIDKSRLSNSDQYLVLKKHFTENITRLFYQKMKLLELVSRGKISKANYEVIYDKVEKSILNHFLLAIQTLRAYKNDDLINNLQTTTIDELIESSEVESAKIDFNESSDQFSIVKEIKKSTQNKHSKQKQVK